MSIITQVFLVNLITLFSVAQIDRFLLDDVLERKAGLYFGVWAISSLISIPAWLVFPLG